METALFSNLKADSGNTPPPRFTNAGGKSDRNGRSSSPRSRVNFEAGVDQEADHQTLRTSRSKKPKDAGDPNWLMPEDPRRQEQIKAVERKARRKAWRISTDLKYADGPF